MITEKMMNYVAVAMHHVAHGLKVRYQVLITV